MGKVSDNDLLEEKQEEALVTFLKKTKDGEFTEIGSATLTYMRFPDLFEPDYEEEAYFFSYS